MSTITFEVPPNVTYGDLLEAKGALMDAATVFIDWERLHDGDEDAVSAPGRVLMALANGLPR